MKVMISGHRIHKLQTYRLWWIETAIETALSELSNKISVGLSGMASGVDLWFCKWCLVFGIPYWACIPFEGQEDTMSEKDAALRAGLIAKAIEVKKVRNRWMVEKCDSAIVVWDGNKGGTHNVFQQLIEAKKDFVWINPVKETIIAV